MADYVWIGKDGKETKREVKGRGRPRTGAVVRDDGNWYIVEGAVVEKKEKAKEAVKEKTQIEKDNENVLPLETTAFDKKPVEEEVEPEVTAERKSKHVREKRKISIAELLKSCHGPVVRTENVITLNFPVITNIEMAQDGRMEMLNLKFNSAYAKIVVDKKEATISVWKSLDIGSPDVIIENALVTGKSGLVIDEGEEVEEAVAEKVEAAKNDVITVEEK